jgi:hypothetical protein
VVLHHSPANRFQSVLASVHVPKMFPFDCAAEEFSSQSEVFALIRLGGDDGTRTHDLLANTPALDGGGRWRTLLPDLSGFADGGERWRTAADVRQMFDRDSVGGSLSYYIKFPRRIVPCSLASGRNTLAGTSELN